MHLDPFGRSNRNEPVQQTEGNLSSGVDGIVETLRHMRRLVREYKRSQAVRDQTTAIIFGIPDKSWMSEIEAVFNFVRDEVRYTLDTHGVELLQTPATLLTTKNGDCDDKCTLLASMLESIGHPTRFVAVGFTPGVLSHVIVQTKIGDEWVSLDPTEPYAMGWEPPDIQSHFIVHN